MGELTEKEVNEAIQSYEADAAIQIGKMQQKADRRKREIETAHQKRLAELASNRGREERETISELARVRREWEDALAMARKERHARDIGGGPGGMPGRPDLPGDLDAKLAGLRAATGNLGEQLQSSVRGTFNAARGLFGFGAGSAAERTARAAEKTAINTLASKALLQRLTEVLAFR